MKKKLALILALALALSALAGCGGGSGDEGNSGETKKEIIIAQANDVKVLDPHNCNEVASFLPICQIYSSLVTTDNDMNIVGDLAESWENISDTEWRFHLREGVKWHDGTDFTANDVKFSIERQKSLPKMGSVVENIVEVVVEDDHTVVLKTDEPSGALLLNLAVSGSRIISEKAVTEAGDSYGEHPIGTGPMKFSSWTLGDKLVLEKNEDYYGDNSEGCDTLIFKCIPEGSARTMALEAGEVDMIIGVEATDMNRIDESDTMTLYSGKQPRWEYVVLNCQKEPFNDPLVRKALNYAIDKESVNIVATDGRAQIANSVEGPSNMGYNADIEAYPYDPEKAKELLAEAGYADGFSTSLWALGDLKARVAQVIQSNLADVGIQVEIKQLEQSAYLEGTANGEHEMALIGWESNGDGDLALYPLFHSTKFGAAGNRSFYSNAEVDALLDQARGVVDQEARNNIYKEIQVKLMDDAVAVPLYFPTLDIAARADLKGVDLHPTGLCPYYKLHY